VKLTEVNEPWKHYIVEDFLEDDDFRKLQTFLDTLPDGQPNDRINLFITDKPEVSVLKEKFEDLLSDINFVSKRPYRIEVEYNSVGKDYEYMIHTDGGAKFVSLVLYVSPRKGEGTKIYNPDKTFHSEVKWKTNSGLLFERTNESFHSYKSKFTSRKTINIICLDNNQPKPCGRRR
jgi:hypothetical protein